MKKVHKKISCLILAALTTGLFINNSSMITAKATTNSETINSGGEELEVKSSNNKKNIALNKKVVSTNPINGGLVASNAVDGDALTRWEFAQGQNNYVVDIPLNEGEDVNSIVINQRVWVPYGTRIQNVKIEAVTGDTTEVMYDGVCGAENLVQTVNGNSQIKGTTLALDKSYTADKIRFTFVAKATGPDDLVNISEIEMYGKVNGAIDLKNFNKSPVYNKELNTLELPKLDGYKVELFGSDRKEVISLDGTVTKPINDVTVKLLYKITDESDNTVVVTDTNAVVEIPARETSVIGENEKPEVIPSLREWVGGSGNFVLNDTSKIVYNSNEIKDTVDTFQLDLLDLTGNNLQVVEGTEADVSTGDIYLCLDNSEPSLGTEGYYLEVGGADGSKDYTVVKAFDEVGVFYGTISMMQILKSDESRSNIPKGLARDYPKFEKRGMMFDVARKFVPIEYLNDLMKQMSWYKLNMLSLHLSDNDIWNSLSTDGGTEAEGWFRLESEMYPELASEEHYTKEEFRKLQYDAMDAGITIIPEFDSPGHALPLTKIWPDLQLGNNKKYLDVTNPEAITRVSKLFDEYILGTNLDGETVYEPTFISPMVNIGTDEYKADHSMKNDFRKYTDELLKHINSTGKQSTFWGSLKENSGDYEVTTDAVMFAWYQGYADAKKSLDEGYKIISMEDLETYIVPGGGYYSNQFGRAEHLYNNWLPNKNTGWAGKNAPEGHPGVLGGQFAVWNDYHGNGISVNDISYRIQHNLYTIAEKSWGGDEIKESGATYNDLKNVATKLGDAPNTDFLYEIDSNIIKDNEIVELDNKVDNLTEENTGANIIDSTNVTEDVVGKNGKAIKLNGGESYIETDINSPGFDWTTAMWLNPDVDNQENSILMEGKTGTLRLENGKIKYDVEQYTHTFDYEIKNNEWTHIALTGTYEGVKLYVNGEFIDELKDKPYPNYNFNSGCNSFDGGFYPSIDGKKTIRYYETLMLPMERIGSESNSFKGSVDELKIYDRVLNANEIATLSGNEKINFAYNKKVTVSSIEADLVDRFNPEYAVDGNTTETRWSSKYNNNEWLQVDLGEVQNINEVNIYWEPACGKQYKILTSVDGVNYKEVYHENNGQPGLKKIKFDTTEARYVKMQGIEKTGIYGYSIYEFEVYGPKVEENIVVSKAKNLKATEVTNNRVTLTWDEPASTVGLVEYIIYKDGKEVAKVPVGTTTYNAEKLRKNTIYGFKVAAKYSNDEVSKPISENVRTKK